MPRNGEASGLDKGFSNSKPTPDWLHPDHVIMNEGVTFDVRYIGCLEIKASMKTLDFATRSQVAKECINRVCEAASLKSSKKRRVDKRVLQCISDAPDMEHAGTNVTLTVSSKYLSLVSVDTGDVIAQHDMPRISFASGGDTDTLDFVAYVAKDMEEWRACYVLECGGGVAQDLIATIGQAFELRYKEFFNKPETQNKFREFVKTDKEYYNDLPDKMPPDLLTENDHSSQSHSSSSVRTRDRISSNLIDLNTPLPNHDYVNDKHSNTNSHSNKSISSSSIVKDVFDMQPFTISSEIQKSQLLTESWYHGNISRAQSEHLLKNDGDFLVRESAGTPGQYVLTGMQNNSPKHLLLIDPEGIVRTKDRIFESISHLINYHWTNSLPIISAESALLLRHPILRTTDLLTKAKQQKAQQLQQSQSQSQSQSHLGLN
ncbi:shc transforming protein [Culex quinquefasciatus]|uniref:Shc transforming protein n=1 Tax=Culex quinquefasciatus TaxID=7176 RepID=B0WGX0_CULQU|nr:SHC-transforming protein 1 [Culex pipiens pallens]EDS27264.1 shc transforming protein [Culex quinquefasciatus]|eukprot:XP_001847954.1 shc transforming protein [Culex quinquefasciatus]